MDVNKITINLTAAREYLQQLNEIHRQLKTAEDQITLSAQETVNTIESTFSEILKDVTNCLTERKNHLLEQTEALKRSSLLPFWECESIVTYFINTAKVFISVSEDVLSESENILCKSAIDNTSFLKFVPEVPDTREVPSIVFKEDRCTIKMLMASCSEFGTIFSSAPVQITSVKPNPGALLVKWQNTCDSGYLDDIKEYRLQKASACFDFQDCYVGTETQHLVRDVTLNEAYSFRVCCKFEGSQTWSPWSVKYDAEATIKPFNWNPTAGFVLPNENKIARPSEDNFDANAAVLFSDGPQYKIGFSIEFTFLECDVESLQSSYVGLSPGNSVDEVLEQKETFYINAAGETYINGTKKLTVLPKVKEGLKVTFSCERISSKKVRVNVDSSDKRVTYDWEIFEKDCFYFFAKFGALKWKIMVE